MNIPDNPARTAGPDQTSTGKIKSLFDFWQCIECLAQKEQDEVEIFSEDLPRSLLWEINDPCVCKSCLEDPEVKLNYIEYFGE